MKYKGDDRNVRIVRSTPCSRNSSPENSSDSNDQPQQVTLASGLDISFQRIEEMVTPTDVTTSGFELIHKTFQSRTEFKAFLKTIRDSEVVLYTPKKNRNGKIVDPDYTEIVKISHILKFLRSRYTYETGYESKIKNQLGLDDDELLKCD